jgi:hypothetical protein
LTTKHTTWHEKFAFLFACFEYFVVELFKMNP